MKRLLVLALLALGIISPAMATDVNGPKATKAPAAVAVDPWAGFYIGGNIGAAFTNEQYDFVSIPGIATGNLWPAGIIAGVTAGYGGTFGSAYVGLEAEFNYSFNGGQAACGAFGQCSVKNSALLTQGVEVGAAMSTITGAVSSNTKLVPPSQWPIPISAPAGFSSANIMPLIKGGIAERSISACEAPVAGMGGVCGDTWLFGGWVGGELRLAAAQSWSVGLDYKYLIFDKSFIPANSVALFGPFTQEFNKLNMQVLELKILYHL